jgi:hypothetical protein
VNLILFGWQFIGVQDCQANSSFQLFETKEKKFAMIGA